MAKGLGSFFNTPKAKFSRTFGNPRISLALDESSEKVKNAIR